MELIYLLSTSTGWLVSVVGLFSLLVGSFLNVVIYRLPIIMEREWKRDCHEWLDTPTTELDTGDFNLVVPRSQCPTCGHKITALENIPVISYLFLRGKCAGCKTNPDFNAVSDGGSSNRIAVDVGGVASRLQRHIAGVTGLHLGIGSVVYDRRENHAVTR